MGHDSLRHCHHVRIQNFSFLKYGQLIVHGMSKFIKLFLISARKSEPGDKKYKLGKEHLVYM